MDLKVSKDYEDEWTILTPPNPTIFKNIATPPFAPLSGIKVKFCFKAWYQQIDSTPVVYLFKLKLLKLHPAWVSPSLEVNANVKVNYNDGSLFEQYDLISENVDKMSAITFKDTLRRMTTSSGYSSPHHTKMNSNTLIIKCQMTFSDYEDLIMQKEPSNVQKSIKYVDLIRNLKSMYEPSVLSDFTFKVSDKSFPAHKVILAAHSPVFKNMMSHEFLESKTNSVTITDATPEIFDSFLRYFYSGEFENKSWDSLKELYYLSDKYDVEFLRIECTNAIISSLSVDLVCEILKFAYSYSDSGFKSAAINFAVKHIKEIVPREDWEELVKDQPMIGYEVTVNFIPA